MEFEFQAWGVIWRNSLGWSDANLKFCVEGSLMASKRDRGKGAPARWRACASHGTDLILNFEDWCAFGFLFLFCPLLVDSFVWCNLDFFFSIDFFFGVDFFWIQFRTRKSISFDW